MRSAEEVLEMAEEGSEVALGSWWWWCWRWWGVGV